jgi:hypothetical protein
MVVKTQTGLISGLRILFHLFKFVRIWFSCSFHSRTTSAEGHNSETFWVQSLIVLTTLSLNDIIPGYGKSMEKNIC